MRTFIIMLLTSCALVSCEQVGGNRVDLEDNDVYDTTSETESFTVNINTDEHGSTIHDSGSDTDAPVTVDTDAWDSASDIVPFHDTASSSDTGTETETEGTDSATDWDTDTETTTDTGTFPDTDDTDVIWDTGSDDSDNSTDTGTGEDTSVPTDTDTGSDTGTDTGNGIDTSSETEDTDTVDTETEDTDTVDTNTLDTDTDTDTGTDTIDTDTDTIDTDTVDTDTIDTDTVDTETEEVDPLECETQFIWQHIALPMLTWQKNIHNAGLTYEEAEQYCANLECIDASGDLLTEWKIPSFEEARAAMDPHKCYGGIAYSTLDYPTWFDECSTVGDCSCEPEQRPCSGGTYSGTMYESVESCGDNYTYWYDNLNGIPAGTVEFGSSVWTSTVASEVLNTMVTISGISTNPKSRRFKYELAPIRCVHTH